MLPVDKASTSRNNNNNNDARVEKTNYNDNSFIPVLPSNNDTRSNSFTQNTVLSYLNTISQGTNT